MLTATSPSSPAAARAMRINSPCALCNAPIVGTSTRRFARGCVCASAMVVRIFTGPHQIATRAGIKNQSPRESGAAAPHSKTQARAKGGYKNGHVLESRAGVTLPLYGRINSDSRNQNTRINTPVIISASIQTKSMLNHARRRIATPSFS